MKRIIVSRKTSQIIYLVIIVGIIIFFSYVYFGDSDKQTIKEATVTCGVVGIWAVMGLFGVRIITPNDIEYYGDMYDKMISGAFSNDKIYYWGLIQAIYFFEHNFVVLTWQCVCCQKIKAVEKVIKICKKELEIAPECEEALYVLTVYHAMNDDDENAEICFEQYCQLDAQEKEVEKLRYVLQTHGIFV